MSDVAANAEVGTPSFSRRLRILGILVLSILAVAAPVLFSVTLHTPEGMSEHGLVTHLLLPTADGLLMLLIVLVARRTEAAGNLDLAWLRRDRREIAAFFFLPVTTLAAMLLAAAAMDKLGLPLPPDRFFSPENKGPVFFVALAIRIVILVPVLEEVFWRGYVQRAFERIAGPLPALIGQAFLFASIHLPPFGRFGPALALGLVAGAWRWRRRTLAPIILAHVLVNGLYCAGFWFHGWDYSRVKVRTDYVAKMVHASRPAHYDPNADARVCYERGFLSVRKMPDMLGEFRRGFPTDWPEDVFAQFRRWVAGNELALEAMAQGAARSYYWPAYAGASAMLAGMPQGAGARDLAFVLDTRIKLRAFDGEDEELVRDVTTLYRFGCHFSGRKVLSHQLFGVAIHTLMISTVRGVLARESLPSETLAVLQERLEHLGDENSSTLDFTLERFVWLDDMQRMFTDDGDGRGRIPRSAVTDWEGLPRPLRLLIDPMTPGQVPAFRSLDRADTMRLTEDFLTYIQEAARKRPWALRNEPNEVRDALNDRIAQNAYVGLLRDACLGAVAFPWQARADLDALVTTIAILRYEREHRRYPESLASLVEQGLLRRAPADPYSEDSLIYKPAADGFLLYSRGLDFDDDGGVPSQWGTGPAGGDQVFWPIR